MLPKGLGVTRRGRESCRSKEDGGITEARDQSKICRRLEKQKRGKKGKGKKNRENRKPHSWSKLEEDCKGTHLPRLACSCHLPHSQGKQARHPPRTHPRGTIYAEKRIWTRSRFLFSPLFSIYILVYFPFPFSISLSHLSCSHPQHRNNSTLKQDTRRP